MIRAMWSGFPARAVRQLKLDRALSVTALSQDMTLQKQHPVALKSALFHWYRGFQIVHPISKMRLSDDILWMSRIRFQLGAQATYNDFYILGRVAILQTPYPLQEELCGQHPPHIRRQYSQQGVLDWRKGDGAACHRDSMPLRVDL